MSTLKANDPNNVAVIVGGVPLGGWGPGDFLQIAQGEDTFTVVTGADGESIRSKSNPKPMVTITITLLESSASNSYLSGLHEADREAPNGAGIVPFLYKDGSGTSLFVSDQCFVSKPPDITKGKEGKERVWTLMAVTKTRLDGQM